MTIKEFEIQLASGTLSYSMKIELVENKRTSKKILTILSKDKDKDRRVRYWVADNSNTPKEALTILSKDEDNSVRYRVANNSNTPKEVLKKLSKDEIADKESGSVSWYNIFVMTDDKIWLKNFKAVSEKDVVQQFRNHYAQLAKKPPVHPTITKIIQDIDEGRYSIRILPWDIDDN